MSFWDKLQALDRRWIFVSLAVAIIIGLFIRVEVPAKADESSISFYAAFEKLPADKPVLLQSDWTNSTRGENAGHLEALLKILIARKQKFVVFSLGDPQAPQVARNVLGTLNQALPAEQRLKKGVDYLDLGYFPNAEGTTQAMGISLKGVWGGRKTKTPDAGEIDIFKSDVLKGVTKIQDCAAVVYITASNTIDVGIQRLSGKIPLFCMCTGVVGPQMLPYWQAGQLAGVAIGLKGVYDMEMMMAYGVNVTPPGKKEPVVSNPSIEGTVEGVPGYVHEGRGKKYYAALNVALGLMVVAILVGNVAMYMAKKTQGVSR